MANNIASLHTSAVVTLVVAILPSLTNKILVTSSLVSALAITLDTSWATLTLSVMEVVAWLALCNFTSSS